MTSSTPTQETPYVSLSVTTDPKPDSSNMYGTMTTSAELPDVTKQDIAASVAILRQNFATGATKDVKVRKQLLRQLQTLAREGAALFQEAMWKDLHKHPSEAFMMELALLDCEIQDHIDHVSDWAKPELATTNLVNLPGLSYIHREPLGVVCIIGTWNYPVQLTLMPLVAALSAGNCALVRLPGDDTSMHLNNALIQLLDKYMDNRYVRYVYGGVEETKAMLRERYDLIFATGGSFLGKIVARAAAEYLTPTVLELGGKSPAIVDASADLALAGKRLAWGAFSNAGQTCVRPDYILVDAKVGDQFVEQLKKNVTQFYGEDPKQSDSYGRVVNSRMFDRLYRLLDHDRSYIVHGGASDDKDKYIAPTIFNFKQDYKAFTNSAVMSEEIFGPLISVYYYESGNIDVPISFVTSHEKPLALYHFSTNSKNKARVVRDTSAGSMMLNDCMTQLSNPHVPFGGVGNSGSGAYHGKFGFEAFSHRKPVIHKYSLLDLPARYPPYSKRKERMLGLVLYPFTRFQWRLVTAVPVVVLVAIIAVIIGTSV